MVVKALLVLLGFILGWIVTSVGWSHKTVGTLRRIHDPDEPGDGPYLYLELEREKLPIMQDGVYVVLKVKDEDNLIRFPQK